MYAREPYSWPGYKYWALTAIALITQLPMHAHSSPPASHQEQEVHPFVGFVGTTVDALRIVAAARL